MLQDVAIGWLQKLRDHQPSNVINGVKIGAGGDYNNIDAAVTDALQELVAEWHQEAPGMVVVCGRRLLNDKYLSLINSTDAPTERNALETMLINKALGGKPTITVPYFPANAFAITSLDNLSIYVQDGSRRRRIKDNAELDQVEDFQSANVDYIVEDYDKMCMYDGVLTPNGAGGWA
jgi:P2 family phage major capsid protein